ncbi:DegV domain-containing protein [Thalassocella blandensis]|nr:DegV domain-containing protein [Thalassocella blandensis]
MSNMAILTDSSCTLPSKVLERYRIKRVPITINIDGSSMADPCDDLETLEIFKSGKLKRHHQVSTEAPTVASFEDEISQAIDSGSRNIIVQTVNRMQGETYNNANAAASNIRRKLQQKSKDISIRVMDSRTVFAGQGLLISETIRRMLAENNQAEVRRNMDKLSSKIHTYVLPREPLTALERAQKRNEKAVGWAQVFIANSLGIHPILCIVNDSSYVAAKPFGFEKSAQQIFKHAQKKIAKGLLSPLVTITYGGPLSELKQLPGYAELVACAKQHNVQVIPSVMSIAGGIYTSVGSLSLAIACEGDGWEG